MNNSFKETDYLSMMVENDNVKLIPLKDKTTSSVFYLNVEEIDKSGQKNNELKPVFVPEVYISANSYRQIFHSFYPEGRIKITLETKPSGEKYMVIATENSQQIKFSQEVVKVSLYANKEDQREDLPISEGYGSVAYRSDEQRNENAIAVAQGKAFSVAMKNLGYTLEDDDNAYHERLKLLPAFIEVPNENNVGTTSFKYIGNAYECYQKMYQKIYEGDKVAIDNFTSVSDVSHKEVINNSTEANFEPPTDNILSNEEVVMGAIDATHESLANEASVSDIEKEEKAITTTEEVIATEELNNVDSKANCETITEEIIDDNSNNSYENESVDENVPEVSEDENKTEIETTDELSYDDALECPLKFIDEYDNQLFREHFEGKTLAELLTIKPENWLVNVWKKLGEQMTEETKKAFTLVCGAMIEN